MRQKDSLGNRQEVAKDECNESIFFQLLFVLLLLFVIQNFIYCRFGIFLYYDFHVIFLRFRSVVEFFRIQQGYTGFLVFILRSKLSFVSN